MYEQRPVAEGIGRSAVRAWRPPTLVAAAPARLGAEEGTGGVGPPGGAGGGGQRWWYVVVDERHDQRCQLTIDPWPALDRQGRLRFDPAVATVDVTVDRDLLRTLVALARTHQGGPAPAREPRIGDAFAMSDDLVAWILDDPAAASAWLVAPAAEPGAELTSRWAEDAGFRWFRRVADRISSGPGTPTDPPDQLGATLAGELADVTVFARELTHAAADEAATGVLEPGDLEHLGLHVRVDEQPSRPDDQGVG